MEKEGLKVVEAPLRVIEYYREMKKFLKCKACIEYPMMPNLMGDGYCKKHNLRFSFGLINQPCPECAIEENICIKCGKKIEEEGVQI